MNKIHDSNIDSSIASITISEYIKELRKKKKITQLELAKYLEKSTMTVIRYEKGFPIKLLELGRILSFLGATQKELSLIKKILSEKQYKIFIEFFYIDRNSSIIENLKNLLNLFGYEVDILSEKIKEMSIKNIDEIMKYGDKEFIITLEKNNEIFLLDIDSYETLPYKLENVTNQFIKKNKLNKNKITIMHELGHEILKEKNKD